MPYSFERFLNGTVKTTFPNGSFKTVTPNSNAVTFDNNAVYVNVNDGKTAIDLSFTDVSEVSIPAAVSLTDLADQLSTNFFFKAAAGAADHSLASNRDIAGNHAKLIPAADGVTAVQITKADGTTALLTFDTLNDKIIANALFSPTLPEHLTTKQYVDNLVSAIFWNNVAAATTGNVDLTLLKAGDIIDGYTLIANDRLLVIAQTLPEQNGLYEIGALAPAVRAVDADTAAELNNRKAIVLNGTANGNKFFFTTSTVVTIDVDPVNFAKLTAITVHNDLTNRDAAGNHAIITPLIDSAESFKITNTAGNNKFVVDTAADFINLLTSLTVYPTTNRYLIDLGLASGDLNGITIYNDSIAPSNNYTTIQEQNIVSIGDLTGVVNTAQQIIDIANQYSSLVAIDALYFQQTKNTDTIGDARVLRNGSIEVCIAGGGSTGAGTWVVNNVPASLTNFLGTWDANLNIPVITSGVGTVGDWYKVGTAGATNIDGINVWNVGDYIWFATNNTWQKINNQVGSGAPGGVNTSVQVNNLGAFAGYPTFTWLDTTKRLGVNIAVPTACADIKAQAELGIAEKIAKFSTTDDNNSFFEVRNGTNVGSRFKPVIFGQAGNSADSPITLEGNAPTDLGTKAVFTLNGVLNISNPLVNRPVLSVENNGLGLLLLSAAGVLSIPHANILTNIIDGLLLNNDTVSTAGVPAQYAPAIKWVGHAWNTLGLIDQKIETRLYSAPLSGSSGIPNVILDYNVNGGAYQQLITINPNQINIVQAQLLLSQNYIVVNRNSLVNTTTQGVQLLSGTAASVGVQTRISPCIQYVARAWNTTTVLSDNINFAEEAGATSGATTSGFLSWKYNNGGIDNNYIEIARLTYDGKFALNTTAPTNDLSFGGNSARTIWLERHTTANTAGNSLTIQAGGATTGATDKSGGDLNLKAGISTAMGDGLVKIFRSEKTAATGSADNAQYQSIVSIPPKFIGNNVITDLLSVQVNTILDSFSISISYIIESYNATSNKNHIGIANCVCAIESGGIAAQDAGEAGEANANSAGGAIGDTFTFALVGTTLTLRVNANTGMVAPTVKFIYNIINCSTKNITIL